MEYEDEELRCLVEAKKLFKDGAFCNDCEQCRKAWGLIDQAILAKYSKMMKEDKDA